MAVLTYNRKALLCLACVFALLSCASTESRKSKSLAKMDKGLAGKYQKEEGPNYFWHSDKNYVWDIRKSKYRDARTRSKAPNPTNKKGKAHGSLSPKLLALKKIDPLLAEEHQNASKNPPAFLRHRGQSYVWDTGALSYRPVKKKAGPKPAPLSPKLLALKKIDPLLAEKYQKEKKEPPDSLSHKSQNYLWDKKTLDYGLVKEKAKPAPLSPKLQALKKIDPLLAEKYEKRKGEPPNVLKYKSNLYLWDLDTLEYRSTKKKLSLKRPAPSPKLLALKRIAPPLAQKYQ